MYRTPASGRLNVGRGRTARTEMGRRGAEVWDCPRLPGERFWERQRQGQPWVEPSVSLVEALELEFQGCQRTTVEGAEHGTGGRSREQEPGDHQRVLPELNGSQHKNVTKPLLAGKDRR